MIDTLLRGFVLAMLIALGIIVATSWAQGQAIEPARRAQICAALRAHGYKGDMDTALKHVARDHNWQHKIAPDSRVLIFLGLGPKPQHLMNPETAWISTPQTVLLAKQ